MSELEARAAEFGDLEPQMRLELLLDYSDRLPPLPEKYRAARDAGLNRVPECQSPVFLWVKHEDGHTHLVADAPPEAPTVRGFVNFLIDTLDEQPTSEVAAVPMDLLHQMGIAPLLGMRRSQGLNAILHRVKKSAEDALA